MTPPPRPLPLLLVPLLLAAGCVSASSGTVPRGSSMPRVSGPLGQKPVVSVPAVAPPARPRWTVVVDGDGPVVRPGQVVIANVDVKVWQGDRDLLNTYDTRQPTTIALDGRHVSRTWDAALLGRRAGSRVLLVSPATLGFGPGGMPPVGVAPSDTLIDVFDIIGGYDPAAQASGVPLPVPRRRGGAALPRVSAGAPGQAPAITVPAGATPPAKLIVQPLLEGGGAALRPGQTAIVQYASAAWMGGRAVRFEASYDRGAPNGFILDRRTLRPGWFEALAGARVGSRLLVVVPEAMNRSYRPASGRLPVAPGAAMVYVIDLVDAR
jgi:peptidylprolyl isomerase